MRRLPTFLALVWSIFPIHPATAADEPSYTRTEDVIYRRKFGTALTMDVFKPKHDANGLGVILVVSGGWISSHEAILPGAVKPLANRGYTVFAVVHGSQPKFTIPEALQDMNRAVRYIRSHARDHEIDPERIGICGASAGGHLSLMQGTAGDEGDPKAKDPVDRTSSRVQAVACFVPPTDFLNYGKPGEVALGTGVLKDYPAPFDFHELDPGRKKFVQVVDQEERLAIGRRISPINHVSPDDPPTLIIHGDADKLVPIQQSELIVEKLREAGVVAKLVVKPGADHVWPDMLKDIDKFADWFDEHLKKGDRGGPAKSSAEVDAPATSRAESPGRREVKSVVLEGTPFNRGMVHGRTLKGEIHELVGLWKRDLSRQFRMDADTFIRQFLAGTDYLPSVKKWTPDLLEEIRGIAEGSGISFETVLAFQLVDEYWANGGAIVGERCSGLGIAGSGDRPTYVAQNMDLEGFRDGYQVVLHVKHTDSGLESFVFTCPGLVALNGMNSRSVGVCVNTLLQLRPRRSGLPVAFVVRGLLERKTVNEAIGFLSDVEHASGQNYILGGPAGIYDFECSAGKVTRFVPEGRKGVVYHTNHPLANDDYTERYRRSLEGGGKNDRGDNNSIARFQALLARLTGDSKEPGLSAIRSALSSRDSAEFPICRPYTSQEAGFTFGSTIMVLSGSPEFLVAAGPPDMATYRSFSFAPAGK